MNVTGKNIGFVACMFTVITNGCQSIAGHMFTRANFSLMMSALATSPLIMRSSSQLIL